QGPHVAVPPHHLPERLSHITRRKRRGRHLVQQRLEQMMVPAVDQRDRHGLAPERLGGVEAAKSTPDDHHVRLLYCRRLSPYRHSSTSAAQRAHAISMRGKASEAK